MKVVVRKFSFWLVLANLIGLLIVFNSAAINGKEPKEKSQILSNASSVSNTESEPANKAANNLRHATVSIQPSQYYLNGDRLFLQLTRPNGESLYLGEIQRRIDSNISVLIPKSDAFINYELSTSSAYDQVIKGKFKI